MNICKQEELNDLEMGRYNVEAEDKKKIRRRWECPICFVSLNTKRQLKEHKWSHGI
jgi:hypothetical protein